MHCSRCIFSGLVTGGTTVCATLSAPASSNPVCDRLSVQNYAPIFSKRHPAKFEPTRQST
jgi:hypothetical protein